MKLVNVLIAISASGTTAIRECLTWDSEEPYNGTITDLEHKIFQRMADFVTVERMWKRPTVAGKKWHLFSLSFKGSAKAKDALDWIADNRAGHFVILGAWNWDTGLQVGLDFDLDDGNRIDDQIYDEEIPNQEPIWRTTGTAVYPQHAQLIKFMPDIIERDSEGAIISTNPATELTDVNLEQGMQPRIFD